MSEELLLNSPNIKREYVKWLDDLRNDPENSKNVKYFEIRDEFGTLLSPDLFIDLILSLAEKDVKSTPLYKLFDRQQKIGKILDNKGE